MGKDKKTWEWCAVCMTYHRIQFQDDCPYLDGYPGLALRFDLGRVLW